MRVVTIAPSTPFLPTLIAALIDGRLIAGFEARTAPARLAEATLYLPTRRAVELARETFLDVLDSDAAVLPRIVPLRDIDEDELALTGPAPGEGVAGFDLPPELTSLERRLLLAPLIARWAAQLAPDDPDAVPLVTGGAAATLALADDLARLIDDMLRRGVGWEALDDLVPDDFDRYWQLTLRFLRIAREHWPPILAAQGKIEPALREQALIAAEAARLTHHAGPVIAAGSTGSMPTTASFLRAIARLPHGAVVLPGLDHDLDDAAWQWVGGGADDDGQPSPPLASHPQFALHGLIAGFGLAREAIEVLAPPAENGREVLASEALRPSGATADWHARLARPDIAARIEAGMARLAVIEAATPETEALAIAVALREAHEEARSVALVTPDRALARRVMAALGRWAVPFDDSGGLALAETSAGLFARLAAGVVAEGLPPAMLLALLKHPLLRLGLAEGAGREAVATLELALFRGPRPAATCAGLRQALAAFRGALADLRAGRPSALHASEPRAGLDDRALDAAASLIERLAAALAPLEGLKAGAHAFATLAARHREVIVALATDADGASVAFAGRDGEMLEEVVDGLVAFDGPMQLQLTRGDYPDAFTAALGDRVVRAPPPRGARVQIYGAIEARLTSHDRVVLGSLVEGVWPPAPRIDPWLSRPMRHQLGLDLPERRIGLSAHDFAQLLGAPEVILTHAAKSGGAPTVASRFLHRLEAVAGAERWAAAQAEGARYLACAAALDWPAGSIARPVDQPAPTPKRTLRPTRLSVTQIEDWLRDPYTIFARHILKLAPLAPVDMAPSVADRGSAIHAALGAFTERFADALPADVVGELVRIGEDSFAPLMREPEARALWWPRFLRIARWFANWERERRDGVAALWAEAPGEMVVPTAGGGFRLTARADRIERRTDGTYALLDYKTGIPPTARQVALGLAPQLTLEAAMLRAGGFAGIAAGASVGELVYVRLSGNDPPGKATVLTLARGRDEPVQSPDEAADAARRNLEALVKAFDNDEQPYTSLNLSMWARRYGDYDDLARIKEWAAASGDEP
jgi:ATP-dependent helicase/nuclease subunit B